MEIKDALRSLLQEMVLPEFEQVKSEQARVAQRLDAVEQRLSDINIHLVDQSRRIDAVRQELVGMIQSTNQRVDRLFEVIVKREEHQRLERAFDDLERRVNVLERRVA
jgi:vacuolar-type H+-ATPase subunit D/Vma8